MLQRKDYLCAVKKIAGQFLLVVTALSYAFVSGLYSLPAIGKAESLQVTGKDHLQTTNFTAGKEHTVITAQRIHFAAAETGTVLKNNLPGVEPSAGHLSASGKSRQQHYLLFSKTLCTGLPGTKLIFPFHYFW